MCLTCATKFTLANICCFVFFRVVRSSRREKNEKLNIFASSVSTHTKFIDLHPIRTDSIKVSLRLRVSAESGQYARRRRWPGAGEKDRNKNHIKLFTYSKSFKSQRPHPRTCTHMCVCVSSRVGAHKCVETMETAGRLSERYSSSNRRFSPKLDEEKQEKQRFDFETFTKVNI